MVYKMIHVTTDSLKNVLNRKNNYLQYCLVALCARTHTHTDTLMHICYKTVNS